MRNVFKFDHKKSKRSLSTPEVDVLSKRRKKGNDILRRYPVLAAQHQSLMTILPAARSLHRYPALLNQQSTLTLIIKFEPPF